MPWWNPFSTDANDGQTAEELDARQRAVEADYRARHDPNPERDRQVDEHLNRQEAEDDYSTVRDEFARGWHEGEDNIRNAVGSTIKGTLGTVWNLLPVWVWLALAVGAFLYLGGGQIVRAVVKKKTA